MSTEAAESQENARGPGTQSGMAKMVEDNFAKMSENIKTLALAVQTMRTDVNELKRRAPSGENDSTRASAPKKPRSHAENEPSPSTSGTQSKQNTRRTSPLQSTSSSQSNNHVISDDEEDIDDLLADESSDDDSDDEQFDMIGNLENFFEGQNDTGPEVEERMAKVTEWALRGEITKQDEENLQALKEKHRRPANIANMQIPKIEQFMWRQLKRETRTNDYVQTKALENYSYILTPLMKALDLFKSKTGKKEETKKAVEYVSDAYKLIGLMVKATNNERMEKVKKELHPDYKSLCEPKKMTATLLMGESASDEIKKVKESSKNSPFESPFLGKRGGARPNKRFFRGASHYQPNNNNHYNNKHNNYNSHSNYKKNQNRGFNKKKSSFQNKK